MFEIKGNVMSVIRPNVMKKRLALARRLANKNSGRLPNPWKMIQLGHSGLYRYIQRHPREFGHFKIEKAVGINGRAHFNVAIREEHLEQARQLATKNGGVLQDAKWLIQKGYTRLASYIKTYPRVFRDLNKSPKKSLTYRKH